LPTLQFYVPDDVADALRARAEERGVSLSSFLGEIVVRHLRRDWPEAWVDTAAAAWTTSGDRRRGRTPMRPARVDALHFASPMVSARSTALNAGVVRLASDELLHNAQGLRAGRRHDGLSDPARVADALRA